MRLGRMSERSAAIGLASASAGEPPPNSSAARLGDERPGHRLARAERGERALGEPRALLHERQHRLRHAVVEPGQGSGRRAVDAGDAQDLLDDVGLHLDVGAPGGDENMRPSSTPKPSRREDRLAFLARECRRRAAASLRHSGRESNVAALTDRRPPPCAKARRRRSRARARSRDRSRGRRSRDRRRARSDSARRS